MEGNRTRKINTKAARQANLTFKTEDELEAKANAYFADCDARDVLYGEAGLALYLGVSLSTLRSWYDGKRAPEFREAVQRAYLRIQSQLESSEIYQQKGMVTKAIFLMKQQRFGGYQDRIEAKQDIAVNIKLGDNADKTDFE